MGELIDEGFLRLQQVHAYIREMERKVIADLDWLGCRWYSRIHSLWLIKIAVDGNEEDEIDFQTAHKTPSPHQRRMEMRGEYGRVRKQREDLRGEKRRESGVGRGDKENQSPNQPQTDDDQAQQGNESDEQAVKEDPRVVLQRYYKQNGMLQRIRKLPLLTPMNPLQHYDPF